MTFKDLPIAISYKSVGEESFSQILNPMLACTRIYKRSVGFFSSSALDFIGDGVLALAKNGGHIYLATSPKLNESDIDAINKGYSERDIIQNAFINEVKEVFKEITDENANILYELIKERIVDVKIVVKDGGMYHDKLAILEDFDGNVVACVGSNNESEPGYNSNYEKVRVYKSWFDQEGRIDDEVGEFDSIWSNNNEALTVYDFMDALKSELIERVEHKGEYKKTVKYKMRPYQIEAKDNWVKQGYQGFYVMATGTGKTVTALYSIQELIRENKVFTIIAVPYKHLVNQWYEDALEFFPDAEIFKVYGEIHDAESKIFSSYYSVKKNYKPIIVITTITSMFIDRFEKLYSKIAFDKLLIVDEAHNFYNKMSDELYNDYKYKLGLSATPVFGNDEGKTKKLLDWFGGIAQNLPIEKAIGKYLVNYFYNPIFVYTTEEDEIKFNKATQKMISATDQRTGKIIDEEKFNKAYRERLRSIAMADEKINHISDIFAKVKEKDHTIVYCSDGKMFDSTKKDNSDIRHLEYILTLINESLIDTKSFAKASKFTSSEDAGTRMQLINRFNDGTIDYLVAIKCLDEGINIPSIEAALILSSNDNYREFVQRRGRILRLYQHDGYKKEHASIYDVIVLPSAECVPIAKIELRRFYEYSRLALNKEELFDKLTTLISDYNLTLKDIEFDNEYIYLGGDLDE